MTEKPRPSDDCLIIVVECCGICGQGATNPSRETVSSHQLLAEQPLVTTSRKTSVYRACTTLSLHRHRRRPTLCADSELINQLRTHSISEARSLGHVNCAACGHLHFRLDDVLIPVALAGGNVAWKSKCWECGHGDIMCPSNSGLQHPSAPDWDPVRAAYVVNTPGLCVSANSAEFDVNDTTGAPLDRGQSMTTMSDAFVQADRILNLSL